MTLSSQPGTADKIISFDGEPGRAAKLSYNVTLPGQYRGRRVIHLDLGLNPEEDIRKPVAELTTTVERLGWRKDGEAWLYDPREARELWFSKAADAYRGEMVSGMLPGDPVAVGGGFVPSLNVGVWTLDFILGVLSRLASEAPVKEGRLATIDPESLYTALMTGTEVSELRSMVLELTRYYSDYIAGLSLGWLSLPYSRWDGRVATQQARAEDVTSTDQADAHFFLVEIYGVSSFLGDYGLGRTVRTFTLLPGEETRISMKTWRTDTTKLSQATSIVDSYDVKSAERFNNTVMTETTDKRTRSNRVSWHAEAEVGGSWGFASAKVSGGAAGEQQSAREQFSSGIRNAIKEHTAEAAANRSNTVSLATERESVTGQESLTERTIRNINLRRVLNFVFRELNQKYTTVVHLLEVKVAFATSTTNSYREVPISGLRTLLEEVLIPEKVDKVAQDVLGLVGTVMSEESEPLTTLEKLDLNANGSYTRAPAAPDDDTGRWAPPPADRSFLYRWRPGPISTAEDDEFVVDGVIMERTTVVMPTADIVVEALLGQADALDEYAMYTQAQEAETRFQENQKIALALETLKAIVDPVQRAEAWTSIFPAPLAPISCSEHH